MSPNSSKPKLSLSKEELIRTLDAFIVLYKKRVHEMPELQEDIDDFSEMSAKLKATLKD
jgi:hypothetical protein